MKKKIIFMLINMNVGGTEKALLNMISEIPKDRYDITLLMLEKYGGFLEYIPTNVKVEYLQGYEYMKSILNRPLWEVAKEAIKNRKFVHGIYIIFLYFISKMFNDRSIVFKYALKDYHKVKTKYDIAVAYAGPVDFISYFVINKINARKKIQWIHFDVTRIGFNQKLVSSLYGKFDRIFTVSEEGKNKLLTLLPSLKTRTDTFINIISSESIIKLADQDNGFQDDFNGIRILTVGRLTKEKGQDLTIPVLAKLKKDGFKVRWYCIGEGSARNEYEQLIKQFGVQNDFILLGVKTNPYPYMKQCDIYIQPSRHEGFCITLTEAKHFNKPIITTNFTGASEQIIDGFSGLIIDFDQQEMYLAIKCLLEDQFMKNQLQNNLQNYQVQAPKEIEKFLRLAN